MINNTIKFELSQDGTIPFNLGKTNFADVLSLGALMYTSESVREPQGTFQRYKTDEAGLKQMILISGNLLETINEIVNVLGLLLLGGGEAINKSDQVKIGWALVALSELSEAVESELDVLHQSRPCLIQDNKNSPTA